MLLNESKIDFYRNERRGLQSMIENAILSYVSKKSKKPLTFTTTYPEEKAKFLDPKCREKYGLNENRQKDLKAIDDFLLLANSENSTGLNLGIQLYDYLKGIKIGFKLFGLWQIGKQSDLRDEIHKAIQYFDLRIFLICRERNSDWFLQYQNQPELHQYWLQQHRIDRAIPAPSSELFAASQQEEKLDHLLAMSTRQAEIYKETQILQTDPLLEMTALRGQETTTHHDCSADSDAVSWQDSDEERPLVQAM
jgi:hypothetical protein